MSGHSPRSDAVRDSPVAPSLSPIGTRRTTPAGSESGVHADVARRHLEGRRCVATRRDVVYEYDDDGTDDDEDGTDDDVGLDEVRGTRDDATEAQTTHRVYAQCSRK